MLCQQCKSIGFRSLLMECLQQCQKRQAAGSYAPAKDPLISLGPEARTRHYESVVKPEEWAGDCDLCGVIHKVLKQRNEFVDMGDTRGLPILFRPVENKIQVCYDSMIKRWPRQNWRVDVHMSEAASEQLCSPKQFEFGH